MQTLEEKMHFLPPDIKENAHIHKVLLPLRVFGAAIYSDQRHKLVIFAMYIFLSINFTPISAMQMYALHPDNWNDIGKVSISAATAILYFSANFQIMLLLFRRKEFVDIITYAARDGKRFYLSKEETEQQIYKDFISVTKYLFMVIYLPAFATIFIMVFTTASAFYNNNQVFETDNAFQAENAPLLFLMYPFRNSTNNYFIAYIYPFLAFLLGGLFISAWHITMAILLLYPNYVFKLIKAKLEKLDEVPESKINEELESLINLQVETTKFTKRIESFISGYVFTDLILFSVFLCFLLYQFSESSKISTADVAYLSLYFFVMSSIQLFYHAIGNDIYYQVDSIATAFYMSSWYNYPVAVQKIGLMMMIGTAKPIQIKAMYIDMSLSTFLNIMRASYGYFAMLRNLNRSEK